MIYHINSNIVTDYKYLLSVERIFIPLHNGTVLIVVYCSIGNYRNTIQLLSYQLYCKTMKNTEGVPYGRGLEAPESSVLSVVLYC